MSVAKYLVVLIALVAIVGYLLFPKAPAEPFDEIKCKELLLKHDPSITDMSFFTSESDSHIDGSNGTTVMKYNISSNKQVFFISSDYFEGCGIAMNPPALFTGNYKKYTCSKEGVSNLFVETEESENYFYANSKIVYNGETFGKIVYISLMRPQSKILFEKNLKDKIDLYGCV